MENLSFIYIVWWFSHSKAELSGIFSLPCFIPSMFQQDFWRFPWTDGTPFGWNPSSPKSSQNTGVFKTLCHSIYRDIVHYNPGILVYPGWVIGNSIRGWFDENPQNPQIFEGTTPELIIHQAPFLNFVRQKLLLVKSKKHIRSVLVTSSSVSPSDHQPGQYQPLGVSQLPPFCRSCRGIISQGPLRNRPSSASPGSVFGSSCLRCASSKVLGGAQGAKMNSSENTEATWNARAQV